MQKKQVIEPAVLEWVDNEPFSIKGEDCYYAHGSGLAESNYVFLQHNNLPQAWLDRDQFTLLETGFGTGLNFLATWDLWLKTARDGQRLHFISVEKQPLKKADLQQALAQWDELAEFSAELLGQYPLLVDGYHRLDFSNGVTLTLLLGEVSEVLPSLVAQVDACYLDGFNPAKNPSMWRAETLTLVAEKLKIGATFATFTAAGNVRRALQALGFEVKKAKGFGKKREMLFGRLLKKPVQKKSALWFNLPQPLLPMGTVAVIGAGIAGVATAAALADRGWVVTLFDAHADVATAGSGNPQAAVLPALTADESRYGRFYRAAFLHTQKKLDELAKKQLKIGWHRCGVVQLAFNARLIKRQRAVQQQYKNQPQLCRSVSAEEIKVLSGVSVSQAGLFYPLAGYLDPTELCKALLAEAKPIERIFNATIEKITRNSGQWQLQQKNSEQRYHADAVVLASGAELKQVAQADYLEMTPARGQVSYIPATSKSKKLSCVLCHEGYLLPSVQGHHLIGATYSSEDVRLDLLAEDQQKNGEVLRRYLPDFVGEMKLDGLSGRVALRGTTPDQLPLVGGLVEQAEFNEIYGDLCHGRPAERYSAPPYEKGLYVLAGLGSRGLSSALLSAELLACQINAEPLPLEKELVDALNPNRFLVRALKKKKGNGEG